MVSIIDTPRNRQDNTPTPESSPTSLEGLNVTSTHNRSDLVAPKSGLFQRNLDRTTENANALRERAENIGEYIGGDGLIGRGIKQAGNTLADIPVNVAQTVVDVDQSIRTGINNTARTVVETSEQVVDAVIDTKNQIIQGAGIIKDQVVETVHAAKELAGQVVDATVDKAQEVASYVAEAPSRIAGWFSSKISAFGSKVKDEMTEVAKKIGGDGLIGKAGVALAESVETGFKGLANVVDKTDDAFGYVLSGDLTTDIAKKGLSVFASAHAKAAEKLASLTENIANITDSATDKTIGLLAREIREVTRDLANISSQTGKFLAGDGILGKPFEKAAELYLGFGEQVGGSLDSFQKIIDKPSHDIAQDVKKWKAWTEMMNKKTDQFHYGIDELRSRVV